MDSTPCDDLAVLSLAGPEPLFLSPGQLTHGPWLPCVSTALFLPNHKSLAPGFLLSTWVSGSPSKVCRGFVWYRLHEQGSLSS